MARKGSNPPRDAGHAMTRPLTVDDVERVVVIDRQLSGRSRRGFYDSRLKAALRHPKRFIYVGVCDGDELVGFVFVRVLEGEFGGEAPVGVLDAIGVDPGRHGGGFGRALLSGLEGVMREKGVRELQSQLDWDNHALLRFLDSAGFKLSSRLVLSRPIDGSAAF